MRVVRCMLMLAVAALLLGNSCSEEDSAGLQTTIGTLAEARTRVESYGAILTTRFPRSSAEYRGGETRYADARAAFDGLIERVVFCIETKKAAAQCDYQGAERHAVESANQFVAFVRELDTDQAKTGAELVAPIVIDVAMKVIDRVKGTSEAERKSTVAMLKGLKVKPIEELSATD